MMSEPGGGTLGIKFQGEGLVEIKFQGALRKLNFEGGVQAFFPISPLCTKWNSHKARLIFLLNISHSLHKNGSGFFPRIWSHFYAVNVGNLWKKQQTTECTSSNLLTGVLKCLFSIFYFYFIYFLWIFLEPWAIFMQRMWETFQAGSKLSDAHAATF